MRVTTKGQVTIPRAVREDIGIIPTKTEIDFAKGLDGRWYLTKLAPANTALSRFRSVHQQGSLRMNTDEILRLTRGD